MSAPGLIADIGGTNARFALVDEAGNVHSTRILPCEAFADICDAVVSFLHEASPNARPRKAAFCVACPVTGDQVALTNAHWTFSIASAGERLKLDSLRVINDFTAVALAVLKLKDEDLMQVGSGKAVTGAPIAVLGPGTGLGVSALVAAQSGWIPIPTEGGHVTMAACNQREAQVIEYLRHKFDHCSAERVLSGPGLVNLYRTLCRLDGQSPADLSPEQITDQAQDGSCTTCAEALDMFLAMLGTVASDLALTYGARGGVYIAGGIVPKLGKSVIASPFRSRYEDKGRFSDYVADIPTFVVTNKLPAFIGLTSLL